MSVEKAYELANEIEEMTDAKVQAAETTTGAILLRAPYIFAYVYSRENGDVMLVETKKDWADRAGVTDTSDRQTGKGWWTHPNVYWQIGRTDHSRLVQVRTVLAKICRVRHS